MSNLLDFRFPVTNYFHVEFVVDITAAEGLQTRGFSPVKRAYYPNEYRNDPTYTIVRMKDFPASAALGLRRFATDNYPRTGFCGDYVAWCFDDRIYSWWNRASCVQRFFVEYWPGGHPYRRPHRVESGYRGRLPRGAQPDDLAGTH